MASGTQVQLANEGKHPCGYFNGVGRNSDHLQQVNYPVKPLKYERVKYVNGLPTFLHCLY